MPTPKYKVQGAVGAHERAVGVVVAGLCFIDLNRPGMDGYEVARRLRESPAGRDALLVALTGWGHEDDRRRAREAGFDHHLTKPVDLAWLLELLGSARRVESP